MKELIERVEGADGPSYALDCAIWDAIYPGERQARFEKLTAKGQPYHLRLGPADMDGYVKPLRSFTASTDDARTLIAADCWLELKGPRKSINIPSPVPNFWSAYIDTWNHENGQMGWGATPALAICHAALKARGGVGMGELWQQQPGAVAFVDGVRKIDGKLADAIQIALRAGYTLEQVKTICRAGQIMSPHRNSKG